MGRQMKNHLHSIFKIGPFINGRCGLSDLPSKFAIACRGIR